VIGGALPVECTESAALTEIREQQWYASVNSECHCEDSIKCGEKFRRIVQSRRAQLDTQSSSVTADHSESLTQALSAMTALWTASGGSCSHFSQQSATCDLACMPRELLPLLNTMNLAVSTSNTEQSKQPYVPQATLDDVRAITAVRCGLGTKSKLSSAAQWRLVQARMQQYADSGSGTIAEAIVHNDCCWRGEHAYAAPSKSSRELGVNCVQPTCVV
jgi:hypothetical protein